MDRKTPKSTYETPEGKIGKIDVLPPVKDLTKIYAELANNEPHLSDRVQLLQLDAAAGKGDIYLILTDVGPKEAADYQDYFGAEREEVVPENFILKVSDANKLNNLPLNYDSEKSRVYKIVQ